MQKKRFGRRQRVKKPDDTAILPEGLLGRLEGDQFRFTKKLGARKAKRKEQRQGKKRKRGDWFGLSKPSEDEEETPVAKKTKAIPEEEKTAAKSTDSAKEPTEKNKWDKLQKRNPEFASLFASSDDLQDSSAAPNASGDRDDKEIKRYMRLLGLNKRSKKSGAAAEGGIIISDAMREDGLGDLLEGLFYGGGVPRELSSIEEIESEIDEESNDQGDQEDSSEDNEREVSMNDVDDDSLSEFEDEGLGRTSSSDWNTSLDNLEEFMMGADESDSEEGADDPSLLDNEYDETFDQDMEDLLGIADIEDDDENEATAHEQEQASDVDSAESSNNFGTGDEFDSDSNSNSTEDELTEEEEKPTNTNESLDVTTPRKYLPPHLRNNTPDTALVKALKSSLNKLSSSNATSILPSIIELYSSNSRQAVTSSITSLILERLDTDSVLDEFLMLYTMVLASVCANVGVAVGGYFVQELVEKLDAGYYKLQDSENAEGKTVLNCVALLGELYLFDVIGDNLVVDLIKRSLHVESSTSAQKAFKEIDLDILLKLLRLVGSKLRRDSPGALKEIVLLVAQFDQTTLSARGKFLMECLMDLKNNRSKLIRNFRDSPEANLIKNVGKAIGLGTFEPLRPSYSDIKNVNKKGKWWIVGSAWDGHDETTKNLTTSSTTSSSAIAEVAQERQHLLRLAKKHGMNTSVRQSIFMVLMSSEDYLDAWEKLMKLGLKDKQEREVVKVIIYCASVEKNPNPYYAHLSTHLCKQKYSYIITFQYTLWDFLKDLEDDNDDVESATTNATSSNPTRRIRNLAALYSILIRDVASLSILKAVGFAGLSARQVTFMQILFLRWIVLENHATIQGMFGRMSKLLNVSAGFKDGLVFFLFTFLAGEPCVEFLKQSEGRRIVAEWNLRDQRSEEDENEESGKWTVKRVEKRIRGIKKLVETKE